MSDLVDFIQSLAILVIVYLNLCAWRVHAIQHRRERTLRPVPEPPRFTSSAVEYPRFSSSTTEYQARWGKQ